MAQRVRLSMAVMFVRDLDVSVGFYREILALEVIDRSPTAALLGGGDGTQLILRAMGGTASHTLGTLGVQYLAWTAASPQDLDRCEEILRRLSAFRERRTGAGMTAVEGRDPDNIVVLITHPGPDTAPLRQLPARIYAW